MKSRIAALASGGLDSSVMLVLLAASHREVQPVFVRCGLPWEDTELGFLEDFLRAVAHPHILPLRFVTVPTDDLYSRQWFATGIGVPGYDDPDEMVEITGRNILLAAKAAVWCRLHGFPALALGILAGNPFADASDEFLDSFGAILSRGLSFPFAIARPLSRMTKADVIRRGGDLPLELTISCNAPRDRRHCGDCNKCRERIDAFREAGFPDPALYILKPATPPTTCV